jgi:bifunctional UDP-N-acetylglucosamine pyrophosphorylase/glucosamine-1-phosphate N-acetyltransferase
MDKTGQVCGIIEEVDATDAQKKIDTINTGIYCVKSSVLSDSLQNITTNNTQGELYLTDIVAEGYKENKKIGLFIGADAREFYGINDRQDLHRVETLMRDRVINRA